MMILRGCEHSARAISRDDRRFSGHRKAVRPKGSDPTDHRLGDRLTGPENLTPAGTC